jgi:hypothetical protein
MHAGRPTLGWAVLAFGRGNQTTKDSIVMRRLLVVLLAVVAVGACSSSNKKAEPAATTTTPTTASGASGWNAAARAAAKDLADKIQAGGVTCTGYTDVDYQAVSNDLMKAGIPVPGAMAQCTSTGGENLTFETFADEAAAYSFLSTKNGKICATAAQKNLKNVSYPYVAATTYFIEPDNKATADRISKILPNTRVNVTQC